MKYRKRVTLFPGVRLNISRSGISTTVGVPGASVNLGRRGAYLNTGIPGTGIYDRRRIGGAPKRGGGAARPAAPAFTPAVAPVQEVGTPAADLTSEALRDLALEVNTCRNERAEIARELAEVRKRLGSVRLWDRILKVLVVGWFVPALRQRVQQLEDRERTLLARYDDTTVDVELEMPEALSTAYAALRQAFTELAASERVWDITHEVAVDRVANRSSAGLSIERVPVTFDLGELAELRCPHGGLHLRNANGADILLFPAFAALLDSDGGLGFVDLRELRITGHLVRFVEHGPVPADASVVDRTWEKVNKDGSPDRRFRDNRQLPVVHYGELRLSSDTGLQEAYHISDAGRAQRFVDAFARYVGELGRVG